MADDYDVAVVGAGPAGSATARRLARSGCRVVLLERSRFDAPRVGESLAPSTNALLAELGVWPRFTGLHPLPSYGTRSAWGGSEPQSHSHLVSPYGCGWHVDRVAFDRMLAEAAADAGAELRCATTCVRVDRDGCWLLSVTEDGRPVDEPVRARVLVDATGRAARIGRQLGGALAVFDRLVGVAALLDGVDVGEEGFVLVEATPDGWWYSAPTTTGQMVGMLMTDTDVCRGLRVSIPGRWHERLSATRLTAARVAGSVAWGPRVFPAASQRLRRTAYDARWIAVGDAALAVDPISGSGVVRALRTARAAATTVLAILTGDESCPIAAYEAERDRECTQYLRERAQYYGAERRWDSAPFWRRRICI
jgi:flavin-dependent dehydrogenase